MGKYQLLPPLNDIEYAALKRDIAERGVIIAIEYDQDGEIIDGYHRAKICEELSITDFPKVVRTYADEGARRSQSRRLNILRRHLDAKTRRELIEAELADNPDRSNLQVAQQLGVSDKTVAKVRDKSGSENPSQKTRKDKRGRKQPASKPRKPRKPEAPTIAPVELPPQPSNIDPLLSCLMRVRALVFEWLPQIPADQWPHLLSELRNEVDHIEQVIEKRKTEENGHHAACQPA